MRPLTVASLSDYPEILFHQPFTEPRGVWSNEAVPFSRAHLDQTDTYLLALASSGSLLLLLLTALSTTRQEALSSLRNVPYVVIAR